MAGWRAVLQRDLAQAAPLGPLQKDLETQAPEQRAVGQLQRLRDLVARLRAAGSPYWDAKLAQVEPGDLATLDQLAALPTTTKPEFREQYPLGMLAVPAGEVVRVHASSGTSGKPTIVAYTAADVATFAEVNARAIACAGGTADDVVQVAYGYGLFTGGLGLHYGVERLGAAAVPASGGNTALQLQLLADLGAAGLCATPSFALLLAERAAGTGRDRGGAGIRLRYGVHGAEPWSEALRAKLEAAWSAVTGQPYDACDIYGLSEVIGPGVAMECREGKGALHVFDDHFLPEVLDPLTGGPAADGDRGELVVTTLTKEAMPVLRYRTGDITRRVTDRCPCGRTFPRIGRLEGRADDMLVIRGVNVFPREVEAEVLADAALSGAYALVVDRRETLPRLEVRAELQPAAEAGRADEIAARVAGRLLERLRVRVNVIVLPPLALGRVEAGKVQRVFERTAEHDPFPG